MSLCRGLGARAFVSLVLLSSTIGYDCFTQSKENQRNKSVTESQAVELLRYVDSLYRLEASIAEIEMKIVNPNYQRTLRVKVWSKGTAYTLLKLLAPAKEKGIATLRRRVEMWNYFPKMNRVMKIPPSMMMGSWMGSDFTNDDLVRETSLADDYLVTVGTESPGTLARKKQKGLAPDVTLVLTPRKNTVTVWGKVIIDMDLKKKTSCASNIL